MCRFISDSVFGVAIEHTAAKSAGEEVLAFLAVLTTISQSGMSRHGGLDYSCRKIERM
jgi:hypothetical protein